MKIIFTITLLTLLSACSSSGKIVDKTYYRFPNVTTKPVNKAFIVADPTAIGILGNRPMVAEASTGGLIQMGHNFWIDSPKLLLYNYLNKVFVSQNIAASTNKLHTKILNLEKKGNVSIVSIKFTIVDSNDKTIFDKTYLDEKTLSQNDIPTFVKSILNSLEKLVQEFNIDSI